MAARPRPCRRHRVDHDPDASPARLLPRAARLLSVALARDPRGASARGAARRRRAPGFPPIVALAARAPTADIATQSPGTDTAGISSAGASMALREPENPTPAEKAREPEVTSAGPRERETGGVLTIDLGALQSHYRALRRRAGPGGKAGVRKGAGLG